MMESNLTEHFATRLNSLPLKGDESNDDTFSIVTWNILADSLANDFPSVPPEYLKWEHRWTFLQKELCAIKSDFIALQEVDRFTEIDSFLKTKNSPKYKGIWAPNSSSPCLSMTPNNGPDGLAFFYDEDKWNAEDIKIIDLPNANNKKKVAIIACMSLKSDAKKQITFCIVHLKAKVQYEEVRVGQMKSLFNQFEKLHGNNNDSVMIVCGDFNSYPKEKPVSMMKEDFNFTSCYDYMDANNVTTCKVRDTDLIAKHIDYIWFKDNKSESNVNLKCVLPLPEVGLFSDKYSLPNETFPSDHMALQASFNW